MKHFLNLSLFQAFFVVAITGCTAGSKLAIPANGTSGNSSVSGSAVGVASQQADPEVAPPVSPPALKIYRGGGAQ